MVAHVPLTGLDLFVPVQLATQAQHAKSPHVALHLAKTAEHVLTLDLHSFVPVLQVTLAPAVKSLHVIV